MRLSKEFRFEASHRLPNHPGKCRRLHGHSWRLTVVVEGEVDSSTGMVMDYDEIKKVMQPIIDDLDHRHLGTWEGLYLDRLKREWGVDWLPAEFNATSENLLLMIAGHLPTGFPWIQLALAETCTCNAVLNFNGDRS